MANNYYWLIDKSVCNIKSFYLAEDLSNIERIEIYVDQGNTCTSITESFPIINQTGRYNVLPKFQKYKNNNEIYILFIKNDNTTASYWYKWGSVLNVDLFYDNTLDKVKLSFHGLNNNYDISSIDRGSISVTRTLLGTNNNISWFGAIDKNSINDWTRTASSVWESGWWQIRVNVGTNTDINTGNVLNVRYYIYIPSKNEKYYEEFGNREICNVIFKAKYKKKIGNRTFEKGEPIFIFDTLKTADLEVSSDITRSQGGRGNQTLVYWDNDKTVNWKIQDALMSPLTFSIMAGAKLANIEDNLVEYHINKVVKGIRDGQKWTLDYSTNYPLSNLYIYCLDDKNRPIMPINDIVNIDNGEYLDITNADNLPWNGSSIWKVYMNTSNINRFVNYSWKYYEVTTNISEPSVIYDNYVSAQKLFRSGSFQDRINNWRTQAPFTLIANFREYKNNDWVTLSTSKLVLYNNLGYNITFREPWQGTIFNNEYFIIDAYEKEIGVSLEVTSEEISGDYIVEADCLWRNVSSGEDKVLKLTIPHAKINTNMTFPMSATGEPAVFDFDMSVLPDYIGTDRKKKVLYSLDLIE